MNNSNFIKIKHSKKDQNYIIEADINERILVDSPPGTGKTYVLIERLKYLFNKYDISKTATTEEDYFNFFYDYDEDDEDDIDENEINKSILVLCFSRAAVKEIKNRLQDLINNNKDLSGKLNQIEIRTFDSYATRLFINDDGEWTDESVKSKNYDERIEYATKHIKKYGKDVLRNYKHFIVDEIQDLVGIRAKFVLTLLEKLNSNCGFTLLGDRCQSIYNYQVKNKYLLMNSEELMNSEDFYEKLIKEYSKPNEEGLYLNEIELTENKRQSKLLINKTNKLRELIKDFEITSSNKSKSKLIHIINSIEEIENIEEINIEMLIRDDKTTAILCRNNGEVLKVSSYLYANGIAHELKTTSSNKNFHKILGELFFDTKTHNKEISKDEFIKMLEETKSYDEINLNLYLSKYEDIDDKDDYWDKFWNTLKKIANSKNSRIKIKDLIKNLEKSYEDFELIYTDNAHTLTVSTIHKSKGREFNDVILVLNLSRLNSSLDKAIINNELLDEIKVYYVSVTRPKEELSISDFIEENYIQTIDGERWIEFNYRKGKCNIINISFNSEIDIDDKTFIDKNLFDDLEEIKKNQLYIQCNINIGDKIILKKQVNRNNEITGYFITHNDNIIGETSDNFLKSLHNAFKLKKYYKDDLIAKFFPNKITNLYVTDVSTVVENSKVYNIVNINGFGKLEWY